jgi:hypothetical protein
MTRTTQADDALVLVVPGDEDPCFSWASSAEKGRPEYPLSKAICDIIKVQKGNLGEALPHNSQKQMGYVLQ